jgi:hypothetical protein
MVNKVLISPAFEKGHFNGIVDEGKYLRQSSLYKQIPPRPVRRSFSEGGTTSRLKTSQPSVAKNPFNQRNPRLNISSCSSCPSWLKNPFNLCNPRLINDLQLCDELYISRDSSTDVMSALQIHLFMQNKAKFQAWFKNA